jgi:hypothetical protein
VRKDDGWDCTYGPLPTSQVQKIIYKSKVKQLESMKLTSHTHIPSGEKRGDETKPTFKTDLPPIDGQAAYSVDQDGIIYEELFDKNTCEGDNPVNQSTEQETSTIPCFGTKGSQQFLYQM